MIGGFGGLAQGSSSSLLPDQETLWEEANLWNSMLMICKKARPRPEFIQGPSPPLPLPRAKHADSDSAAELTPIRHDLPPLAPHCQPIHLPAVPWAQLDRRRLDPSGRGWLAVVVPSSSMLVRCRMYPRPQRWLDGVGRQRSCQEELRAPEQAISSASFARLRNPVMH